MNREFITDAYRIIRELVSSKVNGTVIGISSPLLGSGMYMTGILDIQLEGEKSVIVLNNFDVNGYFLLTNKLPLDQITAVWPFHSKFENPFLRKMEDEKQKKPAVREEMPPSVT